MRINIIIFLLLTLISCDKNKSVISGKIFNAKDQTVYLEEINPVNVICIDSAKIKSSGRFKFNLNHKEPTFYNLRLNNKNINLFLHVNENVSLNAKSDSFNTSYYIFKGSDDNKKLKSLNVMMFDRLRELDSLKHVYEKYMSTSNDVDTLLQNILLQYKTGIAEQRKNNIAFILQNTNSMISYLAVYQRLDDGTYLFNRKRDIQYFKILTDSLKKYYGDSKYVKQLENNTKLFIDKIYTDKALSLIEQSENKLPDINLPDINGDTIALSSFKGKLTLLSFWASKNTTSVEENLKLLPLYKKYHSKGFEIYQVSLDVDTLGWQNQLKFDEIPWVNVCDFTGINCYPAIIYNVQYLPTHYLLDKEQTAILGKNLEYKQLEEELNKHLNK